MEDVDLRAGLAAALKPFEQELQRLTSAGIALTPEQQGRLAQLERGTPLLRQAIDVLIDGHPTLPPPTPVLPLSDGRYEGGNGEVSVELRVDGSVCGVISADLFRVSGTGRDYVASVRTVPGMRASLVESRWQVVGQDEDGRRTTGTLTLGRQGPVGDTLVGTLRLDSALSGLPSRRDVTFVIERTSPQLRRIGIELELETDVEPPRASRFSDRMVTIESALADAGFETFVAGMPSQIPSNGEGWDVAQLHALMQDMAQASLLRRSWTLHLLLLSRSRTPGLLGVMFDMTQTLPRQGAAVFAEEIRGIVGIDHDRKLIQTSVHELGHALNLAHRFERVVGRADSTSFMNYDWRYKGGRQSSEFWERFRYSFDPDELEFLRHAPLAPVIPGGSPFHSMNYWADGGGGYSPYLPEEPLAGFELTLTPPAQGTLFSFAQPIFLGVKLTNRTGRTQNMPSFLLDPKAGFLEILVRRNTGVTGGGLSEANAFIPVVQRCFDWSARQARNVPNGGSIQDNLNLTYGSGGFAFAEPGTYDVTAVLSIADEEHQRELIVRSAPLRIRVATPRTDADERDAMDFFQDSVGLYLALGGSHALPKAKSVLENLVDRHRKAKGGRADTAVAAIVRAQALDASRRYVRFQDGKFQEHQADPAEAARLLESLDDEALRTFDDATAQETRALRTRQRAKAGPRGNGHPPKPERVAKEKPGRTAKRRGNGHSRKPPRTPRGRGTGHPRPSAPH